MISVNQLDYKENSILLIPLLSSIGFSLLQKYYLFFIFHLVLCKEGDLNVIFLEKKQSQL